MSSRQAKPDRPCPECLKPMPYFNKHCYSCGYDYPDVSGEQPEIDSGDGRLDAVVVWSYPGRTQADAGSLFAQHARELAGKGYLPTAQSWADGRPGAGRVFALGVFASALRPVGYLTVTYQRREDAAAMAPAAHGIDVVDQIRKLGQLRDAGYLTADEFETKKLELLSRI